MDQRSTFSFYSVILPLLFQFGRGVPVVIPWGLKNVLTYLSNADVREAAGMSAANKYLFPSKGKNVNGPWQLN